MRKKPKTQSHQPKLVQRGPATPSNPARATSPPTARGLARPGPEAPCRLGPASAPAPHAHARFRAHRTRCQPLGPLARRPHSLTRGPRLPGSPPPADNPGPMAAPSSSRATATPPPAIPAALTVGAHAEIPGHPFLNAPWPSPAPHLPSTTAPANPSSRTESRRRTPESEQKLRRGDSRRSPTPHHGKPPGELCTEATNFPEPAHCLCSDLRSDPSQPRRRRSSPSSPLRRLSLRSGAR